MKKTLLLNPPSFDGFDGGAGARYQARREIKSFWYPTWLAQPAAMIPGSVLMDAPARGMDVETVIRHAGDFELIVLHTSTPSFSNDVKIVQALKAENPLVLIGFVGAHVAVNPEHSVLASPAIDFVARAEFDYTLVDIASGMSLSEVNGISYRHNNGVVHNPERDVIEDMDQLPSVIDVYKRDLVLEDYFIGYLHHSYVSFYTGRGCKSRCTFCLWPQTIGGHRYRTRSPDVVAAEVKKTLEYFPQVKEVFFDDDTLTDDLLRVEALALRLGELGVTWSCNAKANVPFHTLNIMKANGLRLLLVGYETGNQQILFNIKKGMRVEFAQRFTEDCHSLGIKIHGTFIVGLPGETRETISETIQFAKRLNPHTIQVSLAAAYPGTHLYRTAKENGWLHQEAEELVGKNGFQVSSLNYPHLSHQEIFEAAAEFYRRFYFRPGKIAEISAEMLGSWDLTRRRLREGVEFFRYLNQRKDVS